MPASLSPGVSAPAAGLSWGAPHGRGDALARELGERVGVLVVLVRELLHAPRHFAMRVQHMLGDISHQLYGVVPRYIDEFPAYSELRALEAVSSRLVRAVELLRQRAAANAVIASPVDDVRVAVRQHENVVGRAVYLDDGLHVGGYPVSAEGRDRVVCADSVFRRRRAAFAADRPRVYLVSASDDAVVAGSRDDSRVGWRERYPRHWRAAVARVRRVVSAEIARRGYSRRAARRKQS